MRLPLCISQFTGLPETLQAVEKSSKEALNYVRTQTALFITLNGLVQACSMCMCCVTAHYR